MNINYNVGSAESTLKIVLDILGPTLVVLIFLAERIVSYYSRRNDLEIAWYYRIMIESHLVKIDSFFDNTIALLSSSFSTLQSLSVSSLPNQKVVEMAKFSKLKRDFEILTVRQFFLRYKRVAKNLTLQLNDLEDIFTNALDSGNYSQQTQEDLIKEISGVKSNFNEILFMPIEHTKRAKQLP